jgi:hypothetical protein
LRRLLLLVLASAVALAVLAAPAMASEGEGFGPPGGTFYAGNETFQTILTPTGPLPDNGPFDTLYMFPDCASCAPVSDAAPGDGDYNGGRWEVVDAFGITSQLTNAEDVVTTPGVVLVPTTTRFVCPLIKA